MQAQDNLVEIERLVFVCKNLHELFSDDQWNNFLLSPVRQTRDFIQSRYLIFKNVMLEFLDVTDIEQGYKFTFFDEWKKCPKASWVAIGIKVSYLRDTLCSCKKYNKKALETFTSASNEYCKGFKHQSALIDYKIQNRPIYFIEYDLQFEGDRNKALYGSADNRGNQPSVFLPLINLTERSSLDLLEIDSFGKITLFLQDSIENQSIKTDWIDIISRETI